MSLCHGYSSKKAYTFIYTLEYTIKLGLTGSYNCIFHKHTFIK